MSTPDGPGRGGGRPGGVGDPRGPGRPAPIGAGDGVRTWGRQYLQGQGRERCLHSLRHPAPGLAVSRGEGKSVRHSSWAVCQRDDVHPSLLLSVAPRSGRLGGSGADWVRAVGYRQACREEILASGGITYWRNRLYPFRGGWYRKASAVRAKTASGRKGVPIADKARPLLATRGGVDRGLTPLVQVVRQPERCQQSLSYTVPVSLSSPFPLPSLAAARGP